MFQTCRYCYREYKPKRRSSKYCSTRCRVAYNRISENIMLRTHEAYGAVNSLNELVKQRPEFVVQTDRALEKVLNEIIETRRKWTETYAQEIERSAPRLI